MTTSADGGASTGLKDAARRHAPLRLPLIDGRTDVTWLVGGKAANLGRLAAAGFAVPDGFCVTTAAYRAVAEHPDVAAAVQALACVPTEGRAGLRRRDGVRAAAAARVRAAILTAPIPGEVAAAVRAGYAGLGDAVPVAVRSSATAEDLPDASFAGQQDTYLNVIGADSVLDAVRRCWASLWTDRAVRYRADNGIDDREVRLAVVVQRLIDARVAGVLFTANPVTGHRGQTVIDAAAGLGDAVVSGAVNPDHFTVDTATGAVLRRRVGAGAGDACLTDDEVRRLVDMGREVAGEFAAPQDVEWAYDRDGTLWVLQARPVTTLYPLPTGRPAGPRAYFCASAAWQGMIRPVTPMGLAGLRLAASSVAELFGIRLADPARGPNAFATAGMRMFLDLTPAIRSEVGRRLLPLLLGLADSRSVTVVRHLFDDARFQVTDRRRGPLLRRAAWAAVRHGVPLRILEAVLRPEAARRRIDRMGASLARRTTLGDGVTPTERLDFAERIILRSVAALLARIVPLTGVGMAMLGVTRRLVGPGHDAMLQGVLRGLPGNVTTEMDLALWRLAQRARADRAAADRLCHTPAGELARMYRAGDLPAALQDGLSEFLARYGHRAVAESDLGIVRWADEPDHLLATLGNYVRVDDLGRAPDEQFARAAEQGETAVAELIRLARERGATRGRVAAFALRRARRLLGLREQAKFYNIYVLAQARRQLREVGAALAAAGRLATADDVFFVDLPDVRAGLAGADLRDLVAARRQEYDRELRRRHVPQILLSDGTDPETLLPPTAGDGVLPGTPVSAGTASGAARVVLDPAGVRLQPGEILVAPSTDPGWTPLFLTAGALVMETGGVNSHGAVVAREYGIPAVVGVADATTVLHTGQHIVVDGSTGTVAWR